MVDSIKAQLKSPMAGFGGKATLLPGARRASTLSAMTAQPKFSGLMSPGTLLSPATKIFIRDKLISTFQQVTEVFLWAFLAQDAIAMWMPRIRQSLLTGAVKYEADKDPENKGLSPLQLTKRYVLKTLEGLNWINFSEESKREFATGPGVLMIPTLAYSIARRTFGQKSVELGYGSLTSLSKGFIEHLKESSVKDAEAVLPEQFQAELKQYLKRRFDFGPLAQKPIDLVHNFNQETPRITQPVGQYASEWVDRWVDTILTLKGKAQQSELQALEKEFEEAMIGFNRAHRQVEQLYKIDQIPVKLWKYCKDTAGKYGWRNHTELAPAGEFLHDLNRWKDYAVLVYEKKTGGGDILNGVKNKLPELAESIYKRLVTKKAGLAAAVSILTGIYLYKLAFWAQSHDSYHATRLLNEGEGHGEGKPGAPKLAEPHGPKTLVAKAPTARSEVKKDVHVAKAAPDLSPALLEEILNSRPPSAKAPLAVSSVGRSVAPQQVDWNFQQTSFPQVQPISQNLFSNPRSSNFPEYASYPGVAVQPAFLAGPQNSIGFWQGSNQNGVGYAPLSYWYGGTAV